MSDKGHSESWPGRQEAQAADTGRGGEVNHADVERLSRLDLTAAPRATTWPDSGDLLLIVPVTDLDIPLRVGFRRLDADHLAIPWSNLASVSVAGDRMTLIVGARRIAVDGVSPSEWRTADSCLVGVMPPEDGRRDCPTAEQFLEALDEGRAVVAEVGVRGGLGEGR